MQFSQLRRPLVGTTNRTCETRRIPAVAHRRRGSSAEAFRDGSEHGFAVALFPDLMGIVSHLDHSALGIEMLSKDVVGVAAESNEQRVGSANVVQFLYEASNLGFYDRGSCPDICGHFPRVGLVQSDEDVGWPCRATN